MLCPVFEVGDLKVDLAARQVFRGGTEVHLTPTEYKLLAVLIRHAGKLLTHRQLLTEVWGNNFASQTHYLRVYMMQLRQKIEQDREKQLIDDVVAKSGVTVAEDFDIPQVTDQQIQDAMKQQQQMTGNPDEDDAPPPPPAKTDKKDTKKGK